MIGVIVINFRRADLTLECLASLYGNAGAPFHLFLVDNAADAGSRKALGRFAGAHDNVTLIVNDDNRGFTGAVNQALDPLLADPRFDAVALLNNDAVIEDAWLSRMEQRLDPAQGIEMVAARMMDFHAPDRVDSLGIVLYKSGIASNRKDASEPLLGPCGGAALYSTRLLKKVTAVSGYCLDPDFFCYAEDTDLALRARALGYSCAFAEDAVVRHRGSASSGGGYNELVAYYGLRNSLFTMAKNLPAEFFLRHALSIFTMQTAVVLKYLIKAKPRLVWRVYRDFGLGLERVLRQRARMRAQPNAKPWNWKCIVSRRFYDGAYVKQTLRSLHRRDIRPAKP
ncbi:glycosyltransferase family 2 protein [Thiocapsa rosea]|uniref:GT2 family glycosyltransferase n=1 Tax=Thiocapsa rosea TaxID=69360 RepID=A0A495V596_9GAMM|nr:glycosyltransferase family 2 protein [Thiocapsa rosea]RKT44464.1 hypothetical protein BDD21_1848 [Thiocapsa rosea]